MKRNICNLFLVCFGVLFAGCASVDTPDYSFLRQHTRNVDLKKGKIGSGSYTFTSSNTVSVSLPNTGYRDKNIQVLDGNLSIKKSGHRVTMELLTKIPFFSGDLLRVSLDANECGNIKDCSFEVLNSDGTINTKTTNSLRKNQKIKKYLNNFLKARSEFACMNWRVGEIKDKANSKSFVDSYAGDKLTFNILTFPLRYNGVVEYKGDSFYYFSVLDGTGYVESEIYNDKIANLKISGNMLVNIKNFIIEYSNVTVKGNLWAEGFNFNVVFNSSHSFKKVR